MCSIVTQRSRRISLATAARKAIDWLDVTLESNVFWLHVQSGSEVDVTGGEALPDDEILSYALKFQKMGGLVVTVLTSDKMMQECICSVMYSYM